MSKAVEGIIEDETEEEEEARETGPAASYSNPPSFDRLKPRVATPREDHPTKRKSPGGPSEEDPCGEKKPKGSKQEYLKLRNLVPALNERDDISKVEIIEETIRYIDALHHQLAAKNPSLSSSLLESSPPYTDDSSPSTSSSSAPLQDLEESQHLNQRSRKPGTVPSSSSRSSTQDVKAAVENIQAMFAAYLDQKNDGNT